MPAILERLAAQFGAEVILEPEYEIVGLIRFPNGRQSYFWHNKFNLNSVASARVAQDKGYTAFFLKQHGFRVPQYGVFLEDAFRGRIGCGKGQDDARRFAEALGWQVFLKPLRKSQGTGIIRACDAAEYDEAARLLFEQERKLIVQESCTGRDYRLVVLDGEVISAYERTALQVCGDGVRAISALLAARQAEFCATGRDTIIPVGDPRMMMTLRRQGLNLDSVVAEGDTVRMLDIANLSCGGETHVVTEQLHPSVIALAARLAKALDLRFAGVDLMLPDATAPLEDYSVLEVNSAPGLDHYAASGPAHEAHVDALYSKVLEAISRGPI